MTMKKVYATAILVTGLAASAPILAAEPVFYAGLNAGWNATEFEPTTSIDVDGNVIESEDANSASGPAFGGILGVKFPISTGYLGLEANIADSSAEYEASSDINGQQVLDQKVSSDISYGLSGILALNLNAHSQLYAVAGYQMTDIEAKASTRDLDSGNVTNDSNSETFGGVRVGLGLETTITSALSARLEWTSTTYSSEKFVMNTADGMVDTELEGNENRVSLGVIGHF